MDRTRAWLTFVALTLVAVVLAMVFSGLVLSILAFMALIASFFLGQHVAR